MERIHVWGQVGALGLACAAIAAGGCGGGGSSTSSAAGGGDLETALSRLHAAGYDASEGTPIAFQVSDGNGHEYRPQAGATIFKPNTGVYVTLNVSSDPKFIAAFKSQYSGQPVIVSGSHTYGITPASAHGSQADLQKIVVTAEGH